LRRRILISIVSLITLYTVSAYGQDPLDPACAESIERYGVTGFPNSEFVWSFDPAYGEVTEGNGTDTISIRWGYNTGRILLEVVEITSENCSGVPSQARIEIIAPYVNLGNDFPEICDNDSIVFEAGEYHAEPYEVLWHDGSSATTYTGKSTEDIWVRIIDGFGCVRYDTVSLLVNRLPTVNLGNDTITCDLAQDWVLNAGNFQSYHWEYDQLDPSRASFNPQYIKPVPSLPDTIKVTVTDYNGCQASDTIIQLPCDIAGLFTDMVNTITPDGDGVNDKWNIRYADQFPDAVLEIFDRWGRLVYRTAKVQEEPWDGTSKGKPLPMDAYYFILELNALGAEPVVGTVNLIR
jgi:gliding motility-associated-like protein